MVTTMTETTIATQETAEEELAAVAVETMDDHDNGHGNDDDGNDDSNPGNGGGGTGGGTGGGNNGQRQRPW
jgi:hypothetical protein